VQKRGIIGEKKRKRGGKTRRKRQNRKSENEARLVKIEKDESNLAASKTVRRKSTMAGRKCIGLKTSSGVRRLAGGVARRERIGGAARWSRVAARTAANRHFAAKARDGDSKKRGGAGGGWRGKQKRQMTAWRKASAKTKKRKSRAWRRRTGIKLAWRWRQLAAWRRNRRRRMACGGYQHGGSMAKEENVGVFSEKWRRNGEIVKRKEKTSAARRK